MPLNFEILSGNNLINARAIVVLPQPDSPTIPKASPDFIRKETLFTAYMLPLVTL